MAMASRDDVFPSTSVDSEGALLVFDWINETEDIQRLQSIARGDFEFSDDSIGVAESNPPNQTETALQTRASISSPEMATSHQTPKTSEIAPSFIFQSTTGSFPPASFVQPTGMVPSPNAQQNAMQYFQTPPLIMSTPSGPVPVVYVMNNIPNPFYVVQPLATQMGQIEQNPPSLTETRSEPVSLNKTSPTPSYLYAAQGR